jgi:hypothetical protein
VTAGEQTVTLTGFVKKHKITGIIKPYGERKYDLVPNLLDTQGLAAIF